MSPYNEQQLHLYSGDHLSYELTMLHETAMRLKYDQTLTEDIIVRNALIESFTIHARALALFLYPRQNKWPDDVLAEHYVTDVEKWRAERGDAPAELEQVITRTGKEIAHLTTHRHSHDDPRKAWTLERVYLLLCNPLHTFLKHAHPDRLHISVRAFIRELPSPRIEETQQ